MTDPKLLSLIKAARAINLEIYDHILETAPAGADASEVERFADQILMKIAAMTLQQIKQTATLLDNAH